MAKRFTNPVISGFYPDPSVCRVENNFYLVNSTFAYFPGLPIFHSTDLHHWKQIGNAVDRPGQFCYDGNQISHGLFAPTIRYNKGQFFIICTLIGNGGNFIISAKDPSGPWSDPVWLTDAEGIDPSMFFDDDGKVWYCGTREIPGGGAFYGDNQIWIQEIDMKLLSEGKNPLTGETTGIWRSALRDACWSEGPHIYKINSWYYLLYAEGGTSRDHAVCIARAKNIKGPWEGKKSNPLLTHRYLDNNAEVVNVGHAEMFDDMEGNWWMVMLASRPFKGVCPLGRETFMVPIKWEDDWPLVVSKTGLIEKSYQLPEFKKTLPSHWNSESACDHFDGKLPFHWLMLRMPMNEKDIALSLKERPGALRLYTRAASIRTREHPAFTGRRVKDENWAFSAAMEFSLKGENETAGLILLQNENWHYRFEIIISSNSPALRLVRAAGKEDEIIKTEKITEENAINLVLGVKCEDMLLSFFYGKDQYSLELFADNIDARILSTEYASGFVGTLAGVYTSGGGKNSGGFADVFWAEYRSL